MIGIYKITNLVNGKIYIGQSIQVEQRIKNHISELNKNRNHNDHFQSAWNKYGESNFKFEIIHELDDETELDKWEIYYIREYESYNPDKGYNMTFGGKNAILTDTTKANLSLIKRGNNSNLSFEDARHIKLAMYCGMDRKELSDMFNVSKKVLTNISTGKAFEYVSPELNDSIHNLKQTMIDERNKEIMNLYNEGYKIKDIVNKLDLTVSIVEKCVYKYRDVSSENYEYKLKRYNDIMRLYNEGYNRNMISKELNIPSTTVYRYTSKDFDVDKELPYKKVTKEVYNSIINKYFNENMSIKEISKSTNLSRNTIEFYINRYKYANTEVS